jgi:hypothetical protein
MKTGPRRLSVRVETIKLGKNIIERKQGAGTKMCVLVRWETPDHVVGGSRLQQENAMNAETSKAAVEDLIAKVLGGKALDAFDRYYADDVTMQENDNPPRVSISVGMGPQIGIQKGL